MQRGLDMKSVGKYAPPEYVPSPAHMHALDSLINATHYPTNLSIKYEPIRVIREDIKRAIDTGKKEDKAKAQTVLKGLMAGVQMNGKNIQDAESAEYITTLQNFLNS